MDNLVEIFLEYYNKPEFRKFQNTLSREVYESLSISYANSYGEVKMVTEMCGAIDGKTFEKFRFYSKKIHGTRSYVEFCNRDKPTTKELADMVVISVATKNKKIIYEKTAFIQNKKEEAENYWKIDQDQLYLLHNFPTFKGKKGIFKASYKDEVVFLNQSETLGNYGLFQQPGEMVLINALTVYKLQQSNKISLSDIRKFTNNNGNINNSPQATFIDYDYLNDIFYRHFTHYPRYGSPFSDLPFLSNKTSSFNIYEFIRNWTLFNIGEVVSSYGKIVDKDLSDFNKILLKEAGLSAFIDINADNQGLNSDLVIFVAHLNLDE